LEEQLVEDGIVFDGSERIVRRLSAPDIEGGIRIGLKVLFGGSAPGRLLPFDGFDNCHTRRFRSEGKDHPDDGHGLCFVFIEEGYVVGSLCQRDANVDLPGISRHFWLEL
jgi:hypothetical protein